MEGLLSFFSDLILFTAGLLVIVMWLAVLIGIAVEIYDSFKEKDKNDIDDEEVI